ncbi:hypothetical protein QJS66_02640 [Kocuria rhizophila]|nr:hypothetical protein QJS66_02640 [Kocuria rhizophila]
MATVFGLAVAVGLVPADQQRLELRVRDSRGRLDPGGDHRGHHRGGAGLRARGHGEGREAALVRQHHPGGRAHAVVLMAGASMDTMRASRAAAGSYVNQLPTLALLQRHLRGGAVR